LDTQRLTTLSPEFRRHKETTNPAYIMGFLSQWKVYLDQMPQDPNAKFRGKKLDPTSFEKVCGPAPLPTDYLYLHRCHQNSSASCTSLCMRRRMSGNQFKWKEERKKGSHNMCSSEIDIPSSHNVSPKLCVTISFSNASPAWYSDFHTFRR